MMNLRNTPHSRRPLAPIAAAVLVPLQLALVAASCITSAARAPMSLDCDAGAPYDIKVYESYELNNPSYALGCVGDVTMVGSFCAPWYGAADFTPGGTVTNAVPPAVSIPATRIEGDGRCGSQYALLLESHGHQDWGSTFGDYRIGTYTPPPPIDPTQYPIDASQYEGIAFWARDPGYTSYYDGPTTKSIQLSLVDAHGSAGIANGYMDFYDGSACTNYIFDSGGATSIPVNTAMGSSPTGSSAVPGMVYPADACNNAQFTVPLVLSDEWQLYTIPFSAFTQSALPNREPNGIDSSALMTITVTVPKEAQLELWIDDLGFYRTKGNDGGTAEGGP